jgi:hypothetical protein
MTLSAVGPNGGFYTARNDQYTVTHTHASGDTTAVHRIETAITVSKDEKAQWETISEYLASWRPAQRADYFPIPDSKPFIRGIVVDGPDDDHIGTETLPPKTSFVATPRLRSSRWGREARRSRCDIKYEVPPQLSSVVEAVALGTRRWAGAPGCGGGEGRDAQRHERFGQSRITPRGPSTLEIG